MPLGLHPVDAILLLVTLEAAALVLWHRRTGGGPEPWRVLPNLAAGFCLLLALRGCLSGAGGATLALCLAGALLAHLADLRARWPR